MYKVEKYKYNSKTNNDFIHGNIYFLRRTKDGVKRSLTSESDGYELHISDGKMSLAAYHNEAFLDENFTYEGYEMYKSYKDFKSKTKGDS